MTGPLLSDRKIGQAANAIKWRSEDRENDYLAATFVDPGITDRLTNENNQILWGRRGTGKTHVFRILEQEMTEDVGLLGIYVDLSKLGSPGMYEDDRPSNIRAIHLFKDLLALIANKFLDFATSPDTDAPGNLLESQVALGRAITRTILVEQTKSIEEGVARHENKQGGASISLEPLGVSISSSYGSNIEVNEKVVTDGHPRPYISFQELNDALHRVISDGGLHRVYLFLDEWVAVPYDIQPLVAEFIKRSFLAQPQMTVKIAAIEYRSNFGLRLDHNQIVGFELGADIGSGLELDDYFVYDRNADKTLAMFARLLYRHVAVEVEAADVKRSWREKIKVLRSDIAREQMIQEIVKRVRSKDRYLTAEYGISDPDAFIHSLFVDRSVFTELVRAGEGVARDFVNVFSEAFFDAQRRDLAKIDLDSVRAAAREWYERDKAANVTNEQTTVLRQIIEEVIGNKRVRSFLLEKEFETDDMIRSLFDFRLLHLLHRGYVDPEKVGRRFNIYSIDYGAYVELLGSSRAPARDLARDIQGRDVVVPFGDKRGMKRVVLDPAVLRPGDRLVRESGSSTGAGIRPA